MLLLFPFCPKNYCIFHVYKSNNYGLPIYFLEGVRERTWLSTCLVGNFYRSSIVTLVVQRFVARFVCLNFFLLLDKMVHPTLEWHFPIVLSSVDLNFVCHISKSHPVSSLIMVGRSANYSDELKCFSCS